ncbi:MAG: PQQ-binding-like beta-propeller repeat protein, partial [Planctomycetales bacterium]|nr:PQQ-binding-like beta-propeller repeat protein [Planctomycetales bacterium]
MSSLPHSHVTPHSRDGQVACLSRAKLLAERRRLASYLRGATLAIVAALTSPIDGSRTVAASDWPTARYNAQRNAFSPADVDASKLIPLWERRTANPPSPAWYGPAKWDAYSNVRMHSMRNYDDAVTLIGADDRLYYGSSVDDTVTCLQAATGDELWSFFAEAPVRVAPTYDGGRVYFGSDDGYAYCLNASDGKLVWKRRPTPASRLIINNGRFIAPHPIRSGVVVDEGKAYFASSLLPWEPSYLCALDAQTGSPDELGCFVRELDAMTFEGPLALSDRLVVAPQGRVPPLLFSRRTGKKIGGLEGGGGSFVIVTPNRQIAHGPGNKTGWVTVSDSQSGEKLATHGNAKALVVDATNTYMLTKYSLSAVDTESQKSLWRIPCDDGVDLIGVGSVLFVGKTDAVAAYSTQTGDLVWQAPVRGKAFALSFADDRLLVSTDLGSFHAFAPIGPRQDPPASDQLAATAIRQIDPSQLMPIDDEPDAGLIGRWVFQPPHWQNLQAANLAGGPPAVIDGLSTPVQVGPYVALETAQGETNVTVADDVAKAELPTEAFTAAAWVRIDKAQSWGGVFSALQDNGDDEHGWILGYRDSKFCLGVASRDGGGKITYLTADRPFEVGVWSHVAGVYDGESMKIYVNGRLAGTSDAQGGPVRYPTKGTVDIAAYRDKDEHFPLIGAVHEVRLYDRVLEPREIARQFDEKAARFPKPAPPPEEPVVYPLEMGPYLQFIEPGVAEIHWNTHDPSPTYIECRLGDRVVNRVREERLTTSHRVRIADLDRNRPYQYHIEFTANGQSRRTADFECDTFFNYQLQRGQVAPPTEQAAASDDDRFDAAASEILQRSGVTKGLCFDWNAGTCRLAEALVRNSDLRVLCMCSDASVAADAQRRLRALGLYGSRIAVRVAAEPEELGLTPHWANLVVSQETLTHGRPPADAGAVQRVLAPKGLAA